VQWVGWFNKDRLLEPPGYIKPIEAKEKYERVFRPDKIAA